MSQCASQPGTKPHRTRCALLFSACCLLVASCGGGGTAGVSASASSVGDTSPTTSNPTGSSPGASSGTLAPASLSKFDLSSWKLDLPIDRNGGTGGSGGIEFPAQTIVAAQLLKNFVDPYFYADPQGQLIFTAPANGAVTSPGVGSDHVRSELREVYSGPGADVNGDWTGVGTLTGTCAVRAVAARSQGAIIAQLRGQTHDLALLVFRPETADVVLQVYPRNASGSTHTVTPVVRDVHLGDAISYSLSFSGRVLTATVNGTTQSSTVDVSWVGAPLYFKLGAYSVAPNVGNASGDVTMVAYSAFAVSH